MVKDKINMFKSILQDVCSKAFDKVKIFSKKSSQGVDKISKNSNLKKRIISAVILIPLAIYAIYFSKSLFILFTVPHPRIQYV